MYVTEEYGGRGRTRTCDLLRVKKQTPLTRGAMQRYTTGGKCWKERTDDFGAGFRGNAVQLRSRR